MILPLTQSNMHLADPHGLSSKNSSPGKGMTYLSRTEFYLCTIKLGSPDQWLQLGQCHPLGAKSRVQCYAFTELLLWAGAGLGPEKRQVRSPLSWHLHSCWVRQPMNNQIHSGSDKALKSIKQEGGVSAMGEGLF